MRTPTAIGGPVLALLVLAGCQRSAGIATEPPTVPATPTPAVSKPTGAPGSLGVDLNVPFSLGIEQTARLKADGTTIIFADLLEDSRCPAGVACVRAGQVKLRLLVKAPDQTPESVEFTVMGDGPVTRTIGNWAVTVLSVTPGPADRASYKLTLKVSAA